MKIKAKRFLAILLSVILMFGTVGIGASAEEAGSVSPTTAQQYFVEKIFRGIFNGIFAVFGTALRYCGLPEYEEFMAEEDPYFYEGTDGAVTGEQWSLGYAQASVIPDSLRADANGKADADGYCMTKKCYYGGYFSYKFDKIYDDQQVNLVVLSCGSDANGNGVEDILILAALDGIGFSNQDVRTVREAAVKKLESRGVTNEDIIGFNISSTHAHTTFDPQGMGLNLIPLLFASRFSITRTRSIEEALLESIIANASDAVVKAYDNMEKGTFGYFETEEVLNDGNGLDIVNDKREMGQNLQDHFAGFLFTGVSGTKTVLANIGMHPTKVDRECGRLSADVPYYIGQAMKDLGYQFCFYQGAQGSIGLSQDYTEEGEAWAKANALTKEEWASRYGEDYADENYETGEAEMLSIRACAYTIAKLLVDSSAQAKELSCKINACVQETAVPLDYTLLYLGGVTQLLGFQCVKYDYSESGYALMCETGIIDLGDDVTILIMPGEIFPAIVYGVEEGWTGEKCWTGETSWTGEDWEYKSLEQYVREASGDEDRAVLAFGLCNDAIGYVVPDTDASHFSVDWFYGDHYEELLTTSVHSASALLDGYISVFENAYQK